MGKILQSQADHHCQIKKEIPIYQFMLTGKCQLFLLFLDCKMFTIFDSDPIELDVVNFVEIHHCYPKRENFKKFTCYMKSILTNYKNQPQDFKTIAVIEPWTTWPKRSQEGGICFRSCWLLQPQWTSCLQWQWTSSTSKHHVLAALNFLHLKNIFVAWKLTGECFTACSFALMYSWLSFSSFIQIKFNSS